MERKDEIKEILKSLLGKTEGAINKNQYTENIDKIIESSKNVLEMAEHIKQYLQEFEGVSSKG